MDNIKNDKVYYQYDDNDEEVDTLGFAKTLKVDVNNRFFALIGKHKLMIFNIENPEKKIKEYDLKQEPNNRLEQIYDIYIESCDQYKYKCYIACQVFNNKKIKIYDIYKQNQYQGIVVNYFSDKDIENFQVRINMIKKGKRKKMIVILCNGVENFILEFIQDQLESKQRNLIQLKNLRIHYVYNSQNQADGFYLICSKLYDNNLTILNSEDPKFKVLIRRTVLPGVIKIQDMIISKDDQNHREILRISSMLDDEFNLDKIFRTKPLQNNDQRLDNELELTDKFEKYEFNVTSVCAFYIGWPYIVFSGLGNFLIIVNTFDRKLLHRVQLAGESESIKICHSFISDSKDLYVVILRNKVYQLYTIDLDNLNEFESEKKKNKRQQIHGIKDDYRFQLVTEYDTSHVQNKSLKGIHIRGSSRKEVIQLNQKLIIFFLHEENIYSWIESKQGPIKNEIIQVNKSDEKIQCNNLQSVNNNLFYYSVQSGDRETELKQKVMRVEVLFGEYLVTEEYVEVSQQLELLGFNIDQTTENIMLILRPFDFTKANRSNIYLKIWDSQLDKLIFENYVISKTLIGLFQTDAYIFVGDHIYFNNNVIKIRTDLMKQNFRNVPEEELFCEYFNIFELHKDERVKINSPLQSNQSHKFVYILFSNGTLIPKKLIVVPYLHDRRIYLNRMKMNTKYFYTTIQSDVEQSKVMGVSKRIKKKEKKRDEEIIVKITKIICVNYTESKYYIYSENGILLNRVDYHDNVVNYGDLIATSQDGLKYIFQKKNKKEISVMLLTINGFEHQKQVNINDLLIQYIKDKEPENEELAFILEEDSWIHDRKRIIYQFQINNHSDILVKISQNYDFQKKKSKSKNVTKFQEYNNLIYFISGIFKHPLEVEENKMDNLLDFMGLDDENERQNLLSYSYRLKKECTFNDRYLFVWDKRQIEYYDLREDITPKSRKLVNFNISSKQKNARIENIVCGNDPITFGIIVMQIQGMTVLSWNLEMNNENEAYDVENDHSIIFDQRGEINILTKEKLIMSEKLCGTNCYHVDNFMSRNSKIINDQLDYSKGIRFDGENNNWLIMNEYISLPFSYMTFIIKEKLEKYNPQTKYSFDLEAYNYIFNKTTCFLDGNLIRKNYMELAYVLKNLSQIDVINLELLHYTQQDKNGNDMENSIMKKMSKVDFLNILNKDNSDENIESPLSIALEVGNNRCVEIILNYMSKIETNASRKFMSVMPQLTDYQSFLLYIQKLPLQTQQMVEKQILRIAEPLDDEIIAIASSPTVYIDQDFYTKQMKEDDHENKKAKYKSYPVKIEALKVGWIINHPEGQLLLQHIYHSDRLDYYDILPLKMIIEFLYQHNKFLMLSVLLPIYIFQGAVFVMTIMLSEQRFDIHRYGFISNYTEGINSTIPLGDITWAELATKPKSLNVVYTYENQTNTPLNYTTLYYPNENINDMAKAFKFWEEMHSNTMMLLQAFAVMNLVSNVIQILIMVKMCQLQGRQFFKRAYSWIDLIFYTMNILITFEIFDMITSEGTNAIRQQRIFETFGIIMFLLKSFYYMKLADKIAPLVSIIFRICKDIFYFMMILTLAIVACAFSFYLQGRNQVDYGELEEGEVPYATIKKSLWYIWMICLGGGDTDAFENDQDLEGQILTAMYILTSFILIVHLFNMLIAIMGDTFNKNNEVEKQLRSKDHLSFVLDNWYLNSMRDTSSLNYIMTAFQVHETNEDIEIIKRIEARIEEVDEDLTKEIDRIFKKQKEQDAMLRQMLKNQDKIIIQNKIQLGTIISNR